MLSLAPYVWFLIAGMLFLVVGTLAQALLPTQVALIVAEIVCLLGFALFMRTHWPAPRTGWPSWRPAARPVPWLALPVTFVAGALFGLSANLIAAAVTLLSPAMQARAATYAQQVEQLLNPETPWLTIAAIVSVTIFAPVCEEALFRGTLLPVQREHEPVAMAIVLNGLLFSLLHMNLVGFASLWLLGMVVAHLTLSSRSLLPAIACHAGVNTFNGVLVPAIARAQGVDPFTALPEPGEVAAALALALPLSGAAWYGLVRWYSAGRDPSPT